MSDARRSMLDAAMALGIRVCGATLTFALQVLLARLMPAEGYGDFATLWSWMLALGSFATLGFAESSIRFLPRYHLRHRQNAVHGYWRFGLAVVTVCSLATAAAAVGVVFGLGLVGPGLMVILVALGLPFLAIEYYLEGVARSFGWFRLAAVPVYVLRPVLIGGVCFVLWAGGGTLTLPMVGAVVIGSMALVSLGLVLAVARRMRQIFLVRPAPVLPRQRRLWLAASLPLLLLSGLEDLTAYADVLILSILAEPEEVGLYFAAARALALAGFVAYAMTLVAGRHFAIDLAGRSREHLQRSILEATRLTFWATAVAVGGTLFAGPVLLGAFGPEFVAGQGVLWVLGAGLMIRAMAGQAGEVLIVTGRQREGLAIGLIGLTVTVGVGLALVPILGIFGAAIGSAAAMTCRTVALSLVLQRAEGLKVVALGFPSLRPG